MLTMECNQVLPNPPTTTTQYFAHAHVGPESQKSEKAEVKSK